nr:hypothetical protein [Paraburkholderia terrae]
TSDTLPRSSILRLTRLSGRLYVSLLSSLQGTRFDRKFLTPSKHFSGDKASLCFALLRDAGYQIVPKNYDSTSADPALMPEQEWTEGDRKLVSHLTRERAPGLAKAKKAEFRRLHGRLTCERCKLDPVAVFGTEHAEACIEVHHSTTHVSQMGPRHRTKLDDVQCLCANCHRLVHRLLREEDKVSAREDM